jgi:anaerobic selenocysteine-containing dehydrogenase
MSSSAQGAISSGMTRVHHRSCNLCEAMCGINVEVERDAATGKERVVSIRGDDEDPFSRGYICPKATALQDLYEDSDRLVKPLRRRGNDFEEISWDTAFDEVGARINDLRAKHGPHALAIYQGNPTVHSLGAMTFGQVFVRAMGTRNNFSATSADQLPHMLAALKMFGHQLQMPIPDVDRAKLFIIVGANPVASNGSIMTAPGIKRRLRDIQERGGRVVVIDPRRTETAALADQHLFIRPGTDAALLLAMVRVLFDENRVQLGKLASIVDGVERLRAVSMRITIEDAARTTGIGAEEIRVLARSVVDTSPALIYGRVGACTQEFGGLTAWLLVALNALTGNLDRAGGMMFTTPAVDVVPLGKRFGMQGHFAKRRSRVRGLPEFGGELPVAVLAEEIETPGPGQLKGLITSAGNPVLSTPNGKHLERVLPTLELMVSIDMYVNETTRHAQYILPVTSPLEREHYDVGFHALAVRNTARYSEALFERPADARHDWEIFIELAQRAGRGRSQRMMARAAALLGGKRGPRRFIDLALRMGPHKLSVSQLVDRHPHGIDLGPLQPQFPQRLCTDDKRIDVAPQLYVDDVERLCKRVSAAAGDRLVLIGRRDLRSNNSWMHNSTRLVKGPVRCTVQMHPDDASARGLSHGANVVVTSNVGDVELPLEVTDTVMRGVVSIPHGWGHGRPGVRLAVAQAHAGQSINDLTDNARVDVLSGNAAFSGELVEIRSATTATTSPAV